MCILQGQPACPPRPAHPCSTWEAGFGGFLSLVNFLRRQLSGRERSQALEPDRVGLYHIFIPFFCFFPFTVIK